MVHRSTPKPSTSFHALMLKDKGRPRTVVKQPDLFRFISESSLPLASPMCSRSTVYVGSQLISDFFVAIGVEYMSGALSLASPQA